MHYRFILSALLALAAMTGCRQPEIKVKAMTYNIYSCRNSSLEKIARIIREAEPDLVALQEVERFTELNPGDVPAQLAGMTGLSYHYFVHALDIRKGGDYGNVILSRFPILDSFSCKLYGVEETDYVRSFGYVKVEKEGTEFYFGATHLDHKSDDASRLKMATEIVGLVRDMDGLFILGGDFNAKPDSRTMACMGDIFEFFGGSDWQPTVPVPLDNTAKTIDYLIAKPSNSVEAESYAVYYEAAGASDHYPVVAEFRLR